jgi:2-methylcitrate dehydratase PrpD
MTGADQIARFARDLSLEDMPADAIAAAQLHLMDALGVGLAASTGADQRRWSGALSDAGPSTVLSGVTATPAEAAMLNGSLIHSLEYDDTHVGSVIHGSAVAAPVALAMAEAEGATGADLLLAYVIAWEVMIRIGLAAPGAFQARGVQVTAVAGAIGAAAAAGRLKRLSQAEMVSAIGIAGAQASGLLAFLDDGTTAKALNPGWAAHTGIQAVALAKAGMTGPRAVLESPFGLMQTFAGGVGTLADQLDDLGTRWHLPDAAYKLYPCCHYIHPFLETLEGLMADGLTAPDVTQITAHVAAEQAPLICEPWARRQAPVSGYDGKWGLGYCLALMLMDGAVDVSSFEAEPCDEVVQIARRIDWQPVTDSGFPKVFPARLVVKTHDGRTLRAGVDTVRGGPGRTIAADLVLTKYRRNSARRLGDAQITLLQDALSGLTTAPDCTALSKALRVRTKTPLSPASHLVQPWQ